MVGPTILNGRADHYAYGRPDHYGRATIDFLDPLTGAHTNTIEGLWMHAKRERNGNSYVTDALIEYMWRRRFHATTGTTQMGVSMNSLMLCISRVFRD